MGTKVSHSGRLKPFRAQQPRDHPAQSLAMGGGGGGACRQQGTRDIEHLDGEAQGDHSVQTRSQLTLRQYFGEHTRTPLDTHQMVLNLLTGGNLSLGLFEAKHFVIIHLGCPFKVILQHSGKEQGFAVTEARI